MSLHERPRTDPVATHAYTVPIVREVPIHAGSAPPASGPHELGHPLAYAADSHAW
jgi:hypothetical protein